MGACCLDPRLPDLEVTTVHSFKAQLAKAVDRQSTDAPVSKNPRRLLKKKVALGKRQSHDSAEIPNALVLDRVKTSEDKHLIASALKTHFIFTSLTEEQRDLVIEAMKLYSIRDNEVVFEEGQPAVNFFVLASGRMEVTNKSQVLGIITPGHGFGELALLYDTPRTATVTARKDSTLWGIDRKTFKSFVEKIQSQQYEENQRFLDSIEVFQVLTRKEKDSLLMLLKISTFTPGARIVTQGETGNVCFIIKEGMVTCERDGREVTRLGKGEFFGEQTVLYGGVRTATVIAQGVVKCLSIGRQDLQKALGSSLLQVIYRNSLRISFDRCVSLRKLGTEQWEQLIAAMRISSHVQGQVIIPAGTQQDAALWIVLRGELALRGSAEVLASTFTVVGGGEFSSSERYSEDVIVSSEGADVARMSREELEECLGGSLAVATMHSQALDVLARIQLLRGLSREKQRSLLQAMQLRTFADQEVVVRQDDPGDSFFIIESGRVEVIKNGITIRTIAKLDYFGERSMLSNETRSATIVALGGVQCWVMNRTHFNQLIDQSIRKQLHKRIMLQDDSILLQDLVYVKTLGRGMFGVVVLTVHPDTGNRYALKSVSRAKVVKYHLKQNMLLERNILMQLDHTFIVKLIKTFKDQTHMHFLTEYVRGMDFFDVLRKMDALLTSEEARFYVVSLMIILDHLHERDIIYRDLKPENVMIDEDGYPKLIDFGTAKLTTRTYTIIGTPHYMAPEVVMGKGYNAGADYWSVGIMLFEMTCGRVPFGDEEEDPFRIYECILQGQPVYPEWVRPATVVQVQSVVDMLLNRNPSMRLGGSMAHFRKLSWFAGLSWVTHRQDSLLDKQVKSPFIPQLEDLEMQVAAALQRRQPATEAVAQEDPALSKHESQPWEEEF